MMKQTTNRLIHFGILVLSGLSMPHPLDASASRPSNQPLNVLFILADDFGWMDMSPNNPDSFYDTPNLERLAKSGMRLTDAYAASPVCSPTRSAIMTGQFPSRTRNTNYFGGPNGFLESIPEDYKPERDAKFGWAGPRPIIPAPYMMKLEDQHTTLAEAMKQNGYATFFAGKWHLGPEGSWPEDHGFDINKGGHKGGGPYGGKKYFSPYENPRLEDGPEGEHLPDRLAKETADFIANHREKPFLAYLSFHSVHTPLMGRPDLVEKYEKRRDELDISGPIFKPEYPREARQVQEHAIYGAMVEAMDEAIGKVLDALEQHGVADHTLVIFFSDNGGLSTSEGSPTSNFPLRAGKGWLYEGGIREPMVVRWPGVTPPDSVCSQPVICTDFFPTILEACGLPLLPEQHRDGTSLVPLLKDPQADFQPERPLFWHYPHWGNQGGIPGTAIREGHWKLIEWAYLKEPELFNLKEDIGETDNVAGEYPDIASRLAYQIDHWLKITDARLTADNPNFDKEFKKW